ncbi:MAG: hypothetical protein ACREKS_01955 [Candidatus Rokuibacteriota bacterium]
MAAAFGGASMVEAPLGPDRPYSTGSIWPLDHRVINKSSVSRCAGYIYPGIRDTLGFLLVILVLLVRPSGVFGRAQIEKV